MDKKRRAELVDALRRIVHARLQAWDLSVLAEEIAGQDIDTACESVDELLAGCTTSSDASEDDLLRAFGIKGC